MKRLPLPKAAATKCGKNNKNCKIFTDISKMTERRLKMILMHDEEAQCPYCEDWNSVSTED
jgi:thioredoxin-related protein